MAEPDRTLFGWGRQEGDPRRRAEAIRRAVEFVGTYFDEDAVEDKRELERLLREDPDAGLNAVYALGAITAGLVMGDAERIDEDPLEVLRQIEVTLNRAVEDAGD